MRITKTLTLKRSNHPLKQITVKKALLDADLTMMDLARRFNVNPATISLTIAGKTRNLAIQEAIAVALKRPLEELWDMAPRKTRKRKSTPVRSQKRPVFTKAHGKALEIICEGCGNEIDPDVCCCGDLMMQHHGFGSGHSPVPMGCECGYHKSEKRS